jgi:hypothetical protein
MWIYLCLAFTAHSEWVAGAFTTRDEAAQLRVRGAGILIEPHWLRHARKDTHMGTRRRLRARGPVSRETIDRHNRHDPSAIALRHVREYEPAADRIPPPLDVAVVPAELLKKTPDAT